MARMEVGKPDAGKALLQVLVDGTAALVHLDAESLELLQMRALQVESDLEQGTVDERMLGELASRRRILAEVLRATGEHLNLLKRMSRRGTVGSWDL